ncbi:MAG TPA: carbohydrate ABC transporter permease [Arachnia sp.]|jgi:multiple sugar transport system permease protein|nr:carbohydrate ABC transporter permease [Arachnia sp.]
MSDILAAPAAVRRLRLPSARLPGSNPALHRIGRIALYLGLAAFSVWLLMPFFWLVISSLKYSTDVFSIPVRWWPDPVNWNNYVDIWAKTDMALWIRNTMLLAVVVTLLQLFTGSFAAYGFAKMRFPGRDVLFLAYIGTIAVPWQSYMIPQFIMMSQLRLSNTMWSIILLQAFGAFGVFLMKQYYESIPEELSESARLDGLSEYGIWRRIILPLSTPAIATLGLLTFVNTWNDYMGPLIYLRDRSLWTIQIGLRNMVSNLLDANFALMFAGLTISVIPIALIFLAGQRYFVEGIATTGMKG